MMDDKERDDEDEVDEDGGDEVAMRMKEEEKMSSLKILESCPVLEFLAPWGDREAQVNELQMAATKQHHARHTATSEHHTGKTKHALTEVIAI